MPVVEMPLSRYGLLSLAEAAARKGKGVRAVQKWVARGWLPAVVIPAGGRPVYLVSAADLEAFEPPAPGPPRAGRRPGAGRRPKKAPA